MGQKKYFITANLVHKTAEGQEMTTGMELQENGALRCTKDVPFVIHYRARREQVVSWDKAGDVVFSRKIDPPVVVGVPIEDEGPIAFDPYKVRSAFDSADAESESSVRQFLNSAGTFWPFGTVSRSQFREWQTFVKLIRRDDFLQLAVTDHKAQDASKALNNWPNRKFFNFDEPEPTEDDLEWESRIPGLRADLVKAAEWRAARLRELLAYFASPTVHFRSCYTPEATERLKSEDALPTWPPADGDTMPILVYEPSNVLEAIAATISADRLQRIAHRACGGCGRLFLRTKPSQKYCGGADCKDKARATRRMEADRRAREFYTTKRRTGLTRAAIVSMADVAGHVLTSRIIERAEKALVRQSGKVKRVRRS